MSPSSGGPTPDRQCLEIVANHGRYTSDGNFRQKLNPGPGQSQVYSLNQPRQDLPGLLENWQYPLLLRPRNNHGFTETLPAKRLATQCLFCYNSAVGEHAKCIRQPLLSSGCCLPFDPPSDGFPKARSTPPGLFDAQGPSFVPHPDRRPRGPAQRDGAPACCLLLVAFGGGPRPRCALSDLCGEKSGLSLHRRVHHLPYGADMLRRGSATTADY